MKIPKVLSIICFIASITFTFSIECKDKSYCLSTQTCCEMDFGFGCCPYENATCCDDKESCCPNGYKCNTEQQSCDFNEHSKTNFLNVIVQSDDNFEKSKLIKSSLNMKDAVDCQKELENVKLHLTEILKEIGTLNLVKAIAAIEKSIIVSDQFLIKCPEKTPCTILLEKFNEEAKHIKELMHHKQIFGGLKELKDLVNMGYQVLHCK